MVQYWNLTKFSGGEGFIGFWQTMNELTPVFPVFLLMIVFGVSYMFLVNKSKREGEVLDANDAVHYSMFFTTVLSILFYIAGIVNNSQYVYIPGIIYLVTAVIRWYHKD